MAVTNLHFVHEKKKHETWVQFFTKTFLAMKQLAWFFAQKFILFFLYILFRASIKNCYTLPHFTKYLWIKLPFKPWYTIIITIYIKSENEIWEIITMEQYFYKNSLKLYKHFWTFRIGTKSDFCFGRKFKFVKNFELWGGFNFGFKVKTLKYQTERLY